MSEQRQDPAAEFPRRSARTRRFSLGRPRAFRVGDQRVAFLRSSSGTDPVQRLWVLDLATGTQRCVADPETMAADEADLTPEERALRERTREQAGGIVRYATDDAVRLAAFVLGGRLWVADLVESSVRALDVEGPIVDPRPSPDGRHVGFVRDGGLHTVDVASGAETVVAAEDGVTWGLAEFIAAEEMGRTRGWWWSPDSDRLAAARVDLSPVARWHLTDPAHPDRAPRSMPYPAAGTANADVRMAIFGLDDGRVDVDSDREALPYLADVVWGRHGPCTLVLQSRDQRRLELRAVDPASGRTSLIRELTQEPWIELVPGAPRWVEGGRLVTVADDLAADSRRVFIDDHPLSPPGMQVRRVIDAGAEWVTVAASFTDPTTTGVWRLPVEGGAPELASPPEGVHDASAGGATIVISSATLADPRVRTEVVRAGARTEIPSVAEIPALRPRVQMLELGSRGLRGALLLPSGHGRGDGPLPVLLDPYGGPHAQRVVARADAFTGSQWFAEAGFAVLVVDGRGSPGRGPAWEHAVAGDLATAPLADQIDALHAAAEQHPELDLGRVAIRGWSFGGYLAALAVLRRPDVFHAAIAGAPVTDWRLYDTHYTERYLGDPAERPDAYARSSLLADAERLCRPLLLIHGMDDDNVVAAHTLRLSQALLEAGRWHQVLPLSGVTHMTPQEVVAENLLKLQLAFLGDALGMGASEDVPG